MIVLQWLKYLRNEFPTLAFKASTQNQKENLARSKIDYNLASEQLLQSSQCLGAETLMKLLGKAENLPCGRPGNSNIQYIQKLPVIDVMREEA